MKSNRIRNETVVSNLKAHRDKIKQNKCINMLKYKYFSWMAVILNKLNYLLKE